MAGDIGQTQQGDVTPGDDERGTWASPLTAAYMLFVLSWLNVFSYADRFILNLMVEPIKHSFALSDTGISLLQGLAFGLFYTLAAIPIGRLVDRFSRRRIIAVGIMVFGFATACCGLAQNFWQLFAARVGIGAGEASIIPASYSMLADTYKKKSLSGALALYQTGIFAGMGMGYLMGGFLTHWFASTASLQLPMVGLIRPWQAAFIVTGAVSLLAALWSLTIKEPKRHGSERSDTPPVRVVAGYLRANLAFFALMIGGQCIVTLANYANSSWNPALLGRVYGLGPRDVGILLGLIVLCISSLGAVTGGAISNALTRHGYDRAPLMVAGCGALFMWIPGMLAPLMPNVSGYVTLLTIREFFYGFPLPMVAVAIQMSVPGRMRGQISALYLFAINLVGLIAGPTLTGLLSDYVFPETTGVRYSLSLINGVALPLSCLLLVLAARLYPKSVAAADRWVRA